MEPVPKKTACSQANVADQLLKRPTPHWNNYSSPYRGRIALQKKFRFCSSDRVLVLSAQYQKIGNSWFVDY